MSTFLGIAKEFPEIRSRVFQISSPGTLPPKACFLSHIHSDHLQGLDNYIGPVVYCSPATKKLLLRLEKKSVRLTRLCNEVEIEPQRVYRNLGPEHGRDVLRAIPYNTPTKIELDPCQTITVTLFEANHCPGSTMFLIENENKAILYTGDIRAEDWWLESLRRNPILVPYTRGWKRLDCIYLDTTFCGPGSTYETFPSKTQGIGLLISEIRKYPKDTVFHFNAWTYGYEDLWIALASAFNVKIHVDKYRYEIFQSIGDASVYEYGPCLTGYSALSMDKCERMLLSDGCLTLDPNCTRFHSCERGYVCEGRAGRQVVYVHPAVNSHIREPGAGYPRNGSGVEYRSPLPPLFLVVMIDANKNSQARRN
ncbi:beta-lactamase-like protein [Lipomyces chichibuensis]|uniref:beta-lactamase-like protein n=1 Tax=Lipomyces chichibuensis TaxID=1546026 RepID=UPI0033434DB7